MKLFKQLLIVFVVLAVLAGALLLFTYDIIKIQWVSFMGLQPSFSSMEEPLPVPERSIPIEGPAFIPGMGVPQNPVPADEVSVARGAQLFAINCAMCHGTQGQGDGQLSALLANKPFNLTLPLTQTKSDSALFLTISNGVTGRMPAMNENLTVRDRWDVINFIRTLAALVP
jgi:mono/diheme cytochrome c family protein